MQIIKLEFAPIWKAVAPRCLIYGFFTLLFVHDCDALTWFREFTRSDAKNAVADSRSITISNRSVGAEALELLERALADGHNVSFTECRIDARLRLGAPFAAPVERPTTIKIMPADSQTLKHVAVRGALVVKDSWIRSINNENVFNRRHVFYEHSPVLENSVVQEGPVDISNGTYGSDLRLRRISFGDRHPRSNELHSSFFPEGITDESVRQNEGDLDFHRSVFAKGITFFMENFDRVYLTNTRVTGSISVQSCIFHSAVFLGFSEVDQLDFRKAKFESVLDLSNVYIRQRALFKNSIFESNLLLNGTQFADRAPGVSSYSGC